MCRKLNYLISFVLVLALPQITMALEAEDMTLTNYGVEINSSASGGSLIRIPSSGLTGSATYNFPDATGTYDIKVWYYDENDGACTFRIYVASVNVDEWVADQDRGSPNPDAATRTSRTKAAVSIANGAEIKLEAVQDSQEWGRFDNVEITVAGTPTVNITSPSDGATFRAPANITIDADASDNDGSITLVEFYEGINKLGEDTTSPYSYPWNSVPAGSYTLTADATDNDAVTTTSSAVNITVTLTLGPTDVTLPGDTIQDWPLGSAQTTISVVSKAIDNDIYTKYLNFSGDIMPTGLEVTPSIGSSLVTGLTLTTANDVPDRDPTAFELYGSNVSIDGPYTLIASGDTNVSTSRFTKSSISFANQVGYAHYRLVLYPIRGPVSSDPGAGNSMQIAEVELLGVGTEASNPEPADGSVIPDTSLTLQWDPGYDAAAVNGHHVYFGDNWSNVNDGSGGTDKGLTSSTSYPVTDLVMGTTYYWRIDEVNEPNIWPGDIWSFMVRPLTAYDPAPADGIKYVRTDQDLSWEAGSGAVEGHVVIFGDSLSEVNNAPVGTTGSSPPYRLYLTDVNDTNCAPTETGHPSLDFSTTYYWRVDEVEVDPGTIHKGAVWSFTTVPYIPISDPNLVGWWKFDEGESATAVDWSGHSNHGTLQGAAQWVTGYDGNAVGLTGIATNDYVELPTGLVDSNTGSVCVWIKTTQIGRGIIFYAGGVNGFAGYGDEELHLNIDNNANQFPGIAGFYLAGTPSLGGWENQFNAGSAVSDNTWHHLAAMWDTAGGVQLYLDGALVASATYTGDTFDCVGRILLGRPPAAGYYYSGLLDDVRLYDYALSPEQLKNIIALPEAWMPSPADNATDVRRTLTLTWEPGRDAADVDGHKVYFSSDFNDVNDRTVDPNIVSDPCYPVPTLLDSGTTYYWAVDEVNEAGPDPCFWPGNVWSFTTADFLFVDDMEAYTNRDSIREVWHDGYPGGSSGSNITTSTDPNVDGPTQDSQAMAYYYDNDGNTYAPGSPGSPYLAPYYSEAWASTVGPNSLEIGSNWTLEGVKALSLQFQGRPVLNGSFSELGGTYTMKADGASISNIGPPGGPYHDEFHYAYKRLSGIGEIEARVINIQNTDPWAKAGVMIRNTLDPNSEHVMVVVTPTSGVAYQYRDSAGGETFDPNITTGITAPHWVRLKRSMGYFTAYECNDADYAEGPYWTQMGGSVDPWMEVDVYIGLCVTSHSNSTMCTAKFSDVTMTGTITGDWNDLDIGIPYNAPEPMYVALRDNDSNGIVYHSDPNVTQTGDWAEWRIDLNDFRVQGVDLDNVRRMYIGFGNKGSPTLGGSGLMYIDNIRLYRPGLYQPEKKPYNYVFDRYIDYADLDVLANNWLISDYNVTPVPPGDANFVAYYTFNGNFDDSKGTNHGSPNGVSIVADPRGQVASFDEVDDYVDLPTGMVDSNTGSVCVWIKTVQASTCMIFYGGEDPCEGGTEAAGGINNGFGSENELHLNINNIEQTIPGIAQFFLTGSPDVQLTGSAVDDNAWHHLAATWDRAANVVNLYLDGVIAATGAHSGNAFNCAGRILLGRPNALQRYYGGLMDDVRIYSRALSEAEVASLAGKTTFKQPLYLLLTPPDPNINLYDDGTIDFKDIAELGKYWGEDQFWPEW